MLTVGTWDGGKTPYMYAYISVDDYNKRQNAIHLLDGGFNTLKTAAKGALAALKRTLGENASPVVVVKGGGETYVLQ